VSRAIGGATLMEPSTIGDLFMAISVKASAPQLIEQRSFGYQADEEARIVLPVFASERSPLHPNMEKPWTVIERFARGDGEIEPSDVVKASDRLLKMMCAKDGPRLESGLERFRRQFSVGQLESIVALRGMEDSQQVLRALVTGSADGATKVVDESICAGVLDFNERYVSHLRQQYVSKNGLCQQLIAKLTEFHDAVEAAHPGVGFYGAKRVEHEQNAAKFLKQFQGIQREMRKLLVVIPEERALRGASEERMESVAGKLASNHYGDVLRTVRNIIGDARESRNVLTQIEHPDRVFSHGRVGRGRSAA